MSVPGFLYAAGTIFRSVGGFSQTEEGQPGVYIRNQQFDTNPVGIGDLEYNGAIKLRHPMRLKRFLPTVTP